MDKNSSEFFDCGNVRVEEPPGFFSSLPLQSGAAFSPENVMIIIDFYRAEKNTIFLKLVLSLENLFHLFSPELLMQSIAGYIDYTRREYCNDVKCPIQLLLNKEVEKSQKYEEIRAICASDCLHSTHEFHHWLTGKGYLVVRPEHK